jgi:hypothetical protein
MPKPKTSKKPRLGSDNPKSPGSKKVAKKQTKRATRAEGKKVKEEDEESLIGKFITAISSKNYAHAHKYLQSVVNKKIESRINKTTSKPLF